MRVLLALVAPIQIGLSVPHPRTPERSEARSLRDSTEAAALRFFFQWGEAWRVSEAAAHAVDLAFPPVGPAGYGFRELNAACIPTIAATQGRFASAIGGRAIRSSAGLRAACPSWYADDKAPPYDERLGIDDALLPRFRIDIRNARTVVLGMLDSLLQRYPADDWATGQRVRLLVDQGDVNAASAAAQSCRGTPWLCDILQAYVVVAARGPLGEAELAFDRGIARMPVSERCRWTDWTSLIEPPGRASYAEMTCERRESVNRVMWWLADPLYIAAGNERRVEQFARRVQLVLRNALDRDERFDWRPAAGGDARAELVERYGWPAYIYWPGYGKDISHSMYLADDRGGAHHIIGPGGIAAWYKVPGALSEPVSTYEYPRDRVHFIPTWRALLDPFHSESDEWTLSDPDDMPHRSEQFRGFGSRRIPGLRQSPADSSIIAGMTWWPIEHAALPYPIVQLRDGQVALLRRQNHVVIASATDLVASELRRPQQSLLRPVLVVSKAVDSVGYVATRSVTVGTPLRLRGLIDPEPVIVGVEFGADANGPAGRTRFGVVPPPALSAMTTNEVAVSDPVLLRTDDPDRALHAIPDSALERMATSLAVDSGRTFGVYWETYGLRATDSAVVTVWIARYTAQGFMRRMGIALGLAEDRNTPVVVQWREPQPGSNSFVIDGPVPIVGRSLVLDVSRLPKGDYWLDIAVGRPGQDAARGRRGFAIR